MKNKCIKTTDYCTILQQSILDKGTYAYGIERIIVNDGNGKEEIRWVFFKDTIRGKKQLIARPLDLTRRRSFRVDTKSNKREIIFKIICRWFKRDT